VKRFIFLILAIPFQSINYAQELIPFLQGNLYGFSDADGKLVVPADYDEVSLFNEHDFAHVRKGDKWSIINSFGLELLPLELEKPFQLEPVRNSEEINSIIHSYRRGGIAIPNLWQVKSDYYSARLVDLNKWTISEKYSREKDRELSGIANPFTIQYRYGIFIGRVNNNLFHVLDKQGNILLETQTLPKMLNNKYLTYQRDGGCVLYNYQTHKETFYNFSSIEKIINDKYLLTGAKGLINLKGRSKIKPGYKSLKNYYGQILIACRDSTCVCLNTKGHLLTKDVYRKIWPLENGYYSAQQRDLKWIVLDSLCRPKTQRSYDEIKFHNHEKYFTYIAGEHVGILDSALTPEIEVIADGLFRTETEYFYYVQKAGKTGIVHSRKGEIIPALYSKCDLRYNKYFVLEFDSKKGLADSTGRILFPPIYEDFVVEKVNGIITFHPKLNGLYATYDENLKQVHDSVSDNVYPYHVEFYKLTDWHGVTSRPEDDQIGEVVIDSDSSLLFVVELDSTYHVFFTDGQELGSDSISIKRQIYPYGTGLFIASYKNKLGMINHTGKWLIAPDYDDFEYFEENPIIARQGKLYHLFSMDGSRISPHEFDYVYTSCNDRFLLARHNGKMGCLSKNDRAILIPFQYDDITCFAEGYVTTKETELGYTESVILDTLGNQVLKTNFDKLYPANHREKNNFFITVKDGKYGIIKSNGETLFEPQYFRVGVFIDSVFFMFADENCNYYLIDKKGKLLYPAGQLGERLEKGPILPNQRYCIKSENVYYFLDEAGNIIKTILCNDISYEEEFLGKTKLLRVTNAKEKYYLNAETLLEYRSP